MKGKKFLAIFSIGLLLFTQHYIAYGGFDKEIIGHEFYGLILMIASLVGIWWTNLKEGDWKLDTAKEKSSL